MNNLAKYSPLIIGVLGGPIVAYAIIDLERPEKLVLSTLAMLALSYFTTFVNTKIIRNTVSRYPILFFHRRLVSLQKKFTLPDPLLHLLVVLSAFSIGFGFAWNEAIAMVVGLAIWWPAVSRLEMNYEQRLLVGHPGVG